MATFTKAKLSGTPADGRGIKITTTATAGNVIHTAVASTSAGVFDEIWVWATNTSTSAVKITIEYGGVATPDDLMEVTIPAESGLQQILPGLILQNGLIVRCFAAQANVVNIHGFVNSIA